MSRRKGVGGFVVMLVEFFWLVGFGVNVGLGLV